MKKNKVLFWLILMALAACQLVLSWKVTGFSDFYAMHIFPIFTNTYGRLFGRIKISIGELMIFFFVGYTVFTLVIWLLRFVNFCDGKETLKKFSLINSGIFFKLIIVICLLLVQNCFVLYHTTPIYSEVNYEFNRQDLIDLREKLVTTANELSESFERNDKGEIIYNSDLRSQAMVSMQALGEPAKERVKNNEGNSLDEYLQRLSGYYTTPKPFLKSDFMSQQYIMGYYFPFSLESNYNNLMYIANKPVTMCHELAHFKGFILEDEATFLSILGCFNSKDSFFVYSGYLNALYYVENALKTELALEPDIRNSLTKISDKVIFDETFLTDEAWEAVNKDAWFKTETIQKASDTFIETNLTLNGVEDGAKSYSRVVDLLLKHYYGGK